MNFGFSEHTDLQIWSGSVRVRVGFGSGSSMNPAALIRTKASFHYPTSLFQINEVAVTTSRLPNRETFLEWNEFCLVLQKLIHTCQGWKRPLLDDHYPHLCAVILELPQNESLICQQVRHMSNKTMSRILRDTLYDYARENLALVNIYIKQPVVTKILRDQRIPIIWFVANCGGILGLCMGFSIVTVFEVFHCLFKFILSKFKCCVRCCDSVNNMSSSAGNCCPKTGAWTSYSKT